METHIPEMDNEQEEISTPTGEDETSVETAAYESETEISAEPSEPEYRRSSIQGRIDELTREKHEWRRQAERLMDERDAKSPPVRETAAVPTIPDSFPDLPKPQYEDYEDPADHSEAVGRWGTKVELRRYEMAQQQKLQEMQLAHEHQDLQRWGHEGTTKYDDFIEVVSKSPQFGGPTITYEMGVALRGETNGHDIAYHLSQNPRESERISKLDPIHQIREIGKLSYKLENQLPPARVNSQAPASTAPVRGSDTLARKLEDMTTAEFIAHRDAVEYGGTK